MQTTVAKGVAMSKFCSDPNKNVIFFIFKKVLREKIFEYDKGENKDHIFSIFQIWQNLQFYKKILCKTTLTELTTILCSIIQFFCKNKLKLFRICRKFDFYTYGNDVRGGGLPLYIRIFQYPRSLINKIYVYMHYPINFPPKLCSTHLKEAMCTSLFTYWPGGRVGVCAIV